MPLIDVVIVSFNSSEFLFRLFTALANQPLLKSVTVVDNGSSDESVSIARNFDWKVPFHLIEGIENLGFGAAVNLGAARGTAAQILVINPDVFVSSHAITQLSSHLTRDSALGAVGLPLHTSTGAAVSSARDFPTPGTIARRQVRDVDHAGQLVDADWLCGALMLWNRGAFEAVGGFSDDYFLYFEDVDICKKARAAGWNIAIDGELRAIHDQGHGKTTSARLKRVSRSSRRRYSYKWHGLPGLAASAFADISDAAATVYHKTRGG